MSLLTISNLYPRPDRPTMGLFNAQLFGELANVTAVRNACLVPEWRRWRWPSIRKWPAPSTSSVPTQYLPTFYVPVAGRSLAPRFYESALQRLRAGLTGCGVQPATVDAVLAAWLYPDGVAAVSAWADAGVPVWILVQGSDTFHLSSPARRWQILSAANHAAGLFCVCGALASRLVDAGVPPGKVHVTPNGVDVSRFAPLPRDESEAVLTRTCPGAFNGAARKRILFVGNLEQVKGPDVALEAFRHMLLNNGRASAQMVLVGDGPMRKRLQRQVLMEGLDDCVQFVGRRPYDEIRHWMNVADVLLLSSRSEGMPNVILESLACGLPVVATDVGACREMLAGEESGRVVPALDSRGLAAAIGEVPAIAGDRRGLAARQRRRTWADMAGDILARMSEPSCV